MVVNKDPGLETGNRRPPNMEMSQNEDGFVELSVANVKQSNAASHQTIEPDPNWETDEINADDLVCTQDLTGGVSNTIAINGESYPADTYFLLVDESTLKNDVISSSVGVNLDPSIFNCDLSMSSVATDLTPMINQRLTPSVDETAQADLEDQEVEIMMSSHDSRTLLNSVDLSIYASDGGNASSQEKQAELDEFKNQPSEDTPR